MPCPSLSSLAPKLVSHFFIAMGPTVCFTRVEKCWKVRNGSSVAIYVSSDEAPLAMRSLYGFHSSVSRFTFMSSRTRL
jgi:hypothetical protein